MEKTYNIIDEFSKFITTLDESTLSIFEYYCLGDRHNDASYTKITLNDYLNIIREAISKRSNLGYRFVTYKSILNTSRYKNSYGEYTVPIKKELSKQISDISRYKLDNPNNEYYSTLFVSQGNKNIHYNFTFESFHQNSALIFLIHPDIKSINASDFYPLVTKWDLYIRSIIFINPYYIDNRYIYGNRNNIILSKVAFNSHTTQEYRINRYYKMPFLINSIYEETRS